MARNDNAEKGMGSEMIRTDRKKRGILISVTVIVVVFATVFAGIGIHNRNANYVKTQVDLESSILHETDYERTVVEAHNQSDLETEMTDHLQDDIVVQKEENDPVTVIYQQYYDKLIALQNQYGLCEETTEDTDDPFLEENCYLKGLCFAKLLDFDADGTEELILAYHTGQVSDSAFFQNYIIEIWAFHEPSIQKVYSGKPMKEEGSLGIHLSLLDEKYYLYNYTEEFDEETYESNYIDEWRGFDGEVVDVLKSNVWKIEYSDDGETETYRIDGRDVTKEEWVEDRKKWTDLAGDYGFQNGGSTLEASASELIATFKKLSAQLGIEWDDNISRAEEEKPYSDSVWGAELIGYWETLHPESFADWITLTFYEDGMAELHTRSGVCFGAFEIQSEGNVKISLNDEYLYDNSEIRWLHAENNIQIQLSLGSNIYEMNCTYIGGTGESSFPDSAVLNRVEDDEKDYSSASEAIQYYESMIFQ